MSYVLVVRENDTTGKHFRHSLPILYFIQLNYHRFVYRLYRFASTFAHGWMYANTFITQIGSLAANLFLLPEPGSADLSNTIVISIINKQGVYESFLISFNTNAPIN